jgi:hypothetical protein
LIRLSRLLTGAWRMRKIFGRLAPPDDKKCQHG